MKKIGLLDCNNFFVSCERLFRPDLANKPVAVLSSNDGCIVARSPEVKAMGIPMGLPLFQAKQLANMDKVTLFSSNFTLYRDLSDRVMTALAAEVGEIHQYSIDESFFTIDSPTEAKLKVIRERIIQKTGIPVSIGVASTRTLAKEASEIGKKEGGICLLNQDMWQKRAIETDCGDIWNLGRATANKLRDYQIIKASQFMALERSFVRKNFGVSGERIFDELNGTSVYSIDSEDHDSQKSVTSSRSFAETTSDLPALQSAVAYHVTQATKKIRSKKLMTNIMYIELRASRHSDFAHRLGIVSIVLDKPSYSTQTLVQLAHQKVAEVFDPEVPYKKAGVTLSGLVPAEFVSQSLFGDSDNRITLDRVIDTLQDRFGFTSIHSAAILPNADRSSRKMRSPAYTTNWKDIPRVSA